MDPTIVLGHGLLFDADMPTPAAAREAALDWLLARGIGEFDATSASERAEVRRAHWGGDRVGFVNADHADAKPVMVVHLDDELLDKAV